MSGERVLVRECGFVVCVYVCVLPASVGAMCQNVEDGCVADKLRQRN